MTGRRLAKGRHARRSPAHVLPGLSCLFWHQGFEGLRGLFATERRWSRKSLAGPERLLQLIIDRTKACEDVGPMGFVEVAES